MGVLDKVFNIFKGESDNNNEKSYSLKEINEFFNNSFNPDVSNNRLNCATYFTCMQIRCNSMAKLPFKVMQDTGKGKEKATNHYLYDFLKLRPNPFMSMHDFLFASEFQKLEYGNAYIYQDVDKKGFIKGLYLLDPRQVTMYIDSKGILSGDEAIWYVWQNPNGGLHKINHMNIAHLKCFSKDGLIGEPVKKFLAETIQNEQYSSKFLNNHYSQGLTAGAVINYMADLNEEHVRKIKDKFEKMANGIKNAGKIIPMPYGFKLEQLKTKLVDDDFFNLQGLTIRHIANGFGVKLFQLNDLERSTYGNVETQNRAFYSDTLQNELTKTEQEFDYKFLTRFDREKGYYIKANIDVMLRGDFKTRMEGFAIAIQNGILAVDEVRDKEDLPFKEGADKLMCNGNMIPITDVGNQYLKGGEK